jgi:hypothetical protein
MEHMRRLSLNIPANLVIAKHRCPGVVVLIGVRDDDCRKTPAPRDNLIGQLLSLAYRNWQFDEDRLAFA